MKYYANIILLAFIMIFASASGDIFEKSYDVTKLIYYEDNIKEQTEDSILFWPSSIASDSEGNIYILDVVSQSIKKYDSGGIFIKQFGRKGEGPGEFRFAKNNLCQVKVDYQDRVYVLEQGVNRLQVFNSDGKYLTGVKLKHNKLYNSITTDTRGYIYLSAIVEQENMNTVYKYKYEGNKIQYIDTFGKLPFDTEALKKIKLTKNHLMVLHWVSFSFLTSDEDNNIYQVFKMYPYIRKYNSEGRILISRMLPLDNIKHIKNPIKKHFASLENPNSAKLNRIEEYKKHLFALGIDNNYVENKLYISLYMNSGTLMLDYKLKLIGAYFPPDVFTASDEELSDKYYRSKFIPAFNVFLYENITNRFLFLGQASGICYAASLK
ncbi:MAG: 6-bladed beta-propeller [Acidobacteria bacterium]|nr:6-bladed beta-propeller [Acidobacteriota bacterium]